ncbi:8201_t:CDS:2 [Entrophospora sp. SA101]|nr:8201_t:CDS:2 [Entrophospora sp. SA101]
MADNPDNLEIKDNDSSGSGKKKDQYYITISNDGEYIARLDCSKDESLRLKITHHKNFELLNNDSDIEKGQDNVKICNIVKKLTFLDELNPYVKPSEVKDPQKEETKRGNKKQEEQIKEDNRKLLIWSFSISNRFFFNNKPTILVAISRVVPNDMINCDRPINHLIDKLKEYNELKLKYQNMKELHYYPLHSHPSINETCLTSNIGGIVRFLPEVEKNKTSFLITNVKGFYKSLDNLDKPNIHSKLKTRKYGIPTYAISLNNLLLAFTRGNNDIRIYSMESGLFIALKSLDNKDEVLFLEFIHDDERLFIVTRNDTNFKISIKIWDIFNSSPEDFNIKYKINNNIIPKKIDCLNIARSNGMIFFVKEDGKVLNVLKNIEFFEFKVFENDDDNDGIKEEKSFTVFKDFKKVDKYLNHWYCCEDNDADKHKIFDPFKKHDDVGNSKISLLVDNEEKWVDVHKIKPIVNNKEQWVVGCRKFELEVTWVLAIKYYTDKKDKLIVGYLLEYYSNNAIEHIGWMITVSTTLPLLFQSHLEDYVYDLFYKECFTDNNIGTNFKLFLDKELTDNSIGINFKLKEDTESNLLQNSVKKIPFKKIAFGKDNQNRANETKEKTAQKAEGKNKHNTVPFNLCVVPLPNFTVNKIEKKNVQKNVVITFETTIIVKSFEIEDAFGSAKPDQGTIAAISISMLILWIEFVTFIP